MTLTDVQAQVLEVIAVLELTRSSWGLETVDSRMGLSLDEIRQAAHELVDQGYVGTEQTSGQTYVEPWFITPEGFRVVGAWGPASAR